MIETGKRPGVDFILIDLRRADHEEQYRVQSIYLLKACTQPYQHCMLCSKLLGSPRLSGIAALPVEEVRAAAWFADYLNDCHDDRELMESVILLDGIKGWAGAGDEYIAKMQEYDAEIWKE
ncbi:unnamed protein product, partial [Aureobasidium pullulans]